MLAVVASFSFPPAGRQSAEHADFISIYSVQECELRLSGCIVSLGVCSVLDR